MRNIKSSICKFGLAALLIGGSSLAVAGINWDEVKPFVGVNVGKSIQGFKDGFGGDIFEKNPITLSLSAGAKFSDYFGFEMGYETHKKQKSTTRLGEGSKLPGVSTALAAGEYTVVATTFDSHHPYIGVFGETTIVDKTKAQLFLGASLSKIEARQEVIEDNVIGTFSQTDIDNYRHVYKKTKLAPMVRLRVSHEVTDNVSLNAGMKYRYMSNFKIKSTNANGSINEVRMKNAYSFELGVSFSPF